MCLNFHIGILVVLANDSFVHVYKLDLNFSAMETQTVLVGTTTIMEIVDLEEQILDMMSMMRNIVTSSQKTLQKKWLLKLKQIFSQQISQNFL